MLLGCGWSGPPAPTGQAGSLQTQVPDSSSHSSVLGKRGRGNCHSVRYCPLQQMLIGSTAYSTQCTPLTPICKSSTGWTTLLCPIFPVGSPEPEKSSWEKIHYICAASYLTLQTDVYRCMHIAQTHVFTHSVFQHHTRNFPWERVHIVHIIV